MQSAVKWCGSRQLARVTGLTRLSVCSCAQRYFWSEFSDYRELMLLTESLDSCDEGK